MDTTAVRPCAHPTCRDENGNPRLTRDTMCDGCRNRYANTLTQLVEDYVTLKTTFPSPARSERSERSSTRPSYGHPAEWASYNAAEISEALTDAHAALRATLHLNPKPASIGSEARRVANAHRAIRDNWHTYCAMPDTGTYAETITSLHKYIDRTLGRNKLVQRLPTPCPSCELAALTRDVDRITCSNCGRIITEIEYPHLAMIVLDNAIDAYDATAA